MHDAGAGYLRAADAQTFCKFTMRAPPPSSPPPAPLSFEPPPSARRRPRRLIRVMRENRASSPVKTRARARAYAVFLRAARGVRGGGLRLLRLASINYNLPRLTRTIRRVLLASSSLAKRMQAGNLRQTSARFAEPLRTSRARPSVKSAEENSGVQLLRGKAVPLCSVSRETQFHETVPRVVGKYPRRLDQR